MPGEEEASLIAQRPLYPLAHPPLPPPPARLHVPSLCPEPSHAPPVALPGPATREWGSTLCSNTALPHCPHLCLAKDMAPHCCARDWPS